MDNSFRRSDTSLGHGTREPDVEPVSNRRDRPVDFAHGTVHQPRVKPVSRGSVTRAIVAEVALACKRVAVSQQPEMFDLSWLDPVDRAGVVATLGLGTVSVRMKGDPIIAAQDAGLPGLWFLEGAGFDRLEVAPLPTLLFERAFTATYPAAEHDLVSGAVTESTAAVLADLDRRSQNFTPRTGGFLAELTELGLSPAEVGAVEAGLGVGSVTILNRANGTCMVKATALDHVWRVQAADLHGRVVFDAFEVTRIPAFGKALSNRSEYLATSARLFEELETETAR